MRRSSELRSLSNTTNGRIRNGERICKETRRSRTRLLSIKTLEEEEETDQKRTRLANGINPKANRGKEVVDEHEKPGPKKVSRNVA
jgi:hypothetical protein